MVYDYAVVFFLLMPQLVKRRDGWHVDLAGPVQGPELHVTLESAVDAAMGWFDKGRTHAALVMKRDGIKMVGVRYFGFLPERCLHGERKVSSSMAREYMRVDLSQIRKPGPSRVEYD